MVYGRCLRPALYSSLRSSPSHPTGVSALRVTIAIANVRFGRKQRGLRKSTAKSRRLFRNESATSRRVRAGAIGGSTAMTRTAFCRKSPRVPRVCWLGSWALGTSDRGGQDKAGFPASGTSFLSFCLHIVLGRSLTFRRDERAAHFLIVILFQCSERRRPRHAENRR